MAAATEKINEILEYLSNRRVGELPDDLLSAGTDPPKTFEELVLALDAVPVDLEKERSRQERPKEVAE